MPGNVEKQIGNASFTIGDRVKLARMGSSWLDESKNLKEFTQASISSKMSLNRTSYLNNVERSETRPNKDFIGRFERAIGIKNGTLLQDSCSLDPTVQDIPAVTLPSYPKAKRGDGKESLEFKIANTVEDRIVKGEYREKLPRGSILAQEFQTTRYTVIKALRSLKQKGLIEGKKREGTIINYTQP